jgi:hypothetical protein
MEQTSNNILENKMEPKAKGRPKAEAKPDKAVKEKVVKEKPDKAVKEKVVKVKVVKEKPDNEPKEKVVKEKVVKTDLIKPDKEPKEKVVKEPKPKHFKLQSEEKELLHAQLKLKQFRDSERNYTEAIKQLSNTKKAK